MNALERFERLAGQARREAVPALDVTARVIAKLRQPEPVEASVPMFAFAGLSLAAASPDDGIGCIRSFTPAILHIDG